MRTLRSAIVVLMVAILPMASLAWAAPGRVPVPSHPALVRPPLQPAITGTVVAWGCGYPYDFGQCALPTGLRGVTAISANKSHNLALLSDSTVVAWGCGLGTDAGQCLPPAGLNAVAAIAAGFYHSLALKSDGTVVAWGSPEGGLIDVPAELSGVVAIDAGRGHSLALKGDGTVVAWGCGSTSTLGSVLFRLGWAR